MEQIQEKLKKSSKAMAAIMKIGQIFCIVGFCIAIVLIAWLFTFNSTQPITVLQDTAHSLTINPPVGNADDYHVGELIALAVLGIILVVVYFFAFRNGHKVFRGICETGEPFREEYAGLIRSVAWMMVVCAVIRMVGVNVIGALIGTGADGSFPAGYIICALMLLCFSRIFQYGAQLQQLSDETL